MVEIGDNTFSQCFPEIETSIRASSFIAIDLEFLGLPSSSYPKSVSLFDSPSERYIKLCQSVKKFPPCQLGIACFKEAGNSFKVDIFTIHLFKRLCKRVFSFSLSALTFLAHNNFDFNKFVSEGVTYLNKNEFSSIKREIINGTFDYDTLTDNLEKRLEMLKMKILLEATVEDEPLKRESETAEKTSFCRDERVRLARPLLIELCTKDCHEEEAFDASGGESEAVLWDCALSSVEAAAVVHVLSNEFPFFDFQVDPSKTLLYVAETPLIFRNSSERKRHKTHLKGFLNEMLGVSRIFQIISETKKPAVGHNSLLDFMHIYNYFEAELPETYAEWKTSMTASFPTVIDTKVLASSLQDHFSSQGVGDLSLQTIGNYFESPSCGAILPFDPPQIVIGDHMPSSFLENKQFHNAGYDALVTGQIFIKMAHLYAFSKCSSQDPSTFPWPFQKLLIVLKSKVSNRIPIPLIDSQHCYLLGEDPVGKRPDIIQIRKRRNLQWPRYLSENEAFIQFFERVADSVFPPIAVELEECLRLQDDLSRILGGFRVEVRTDGSNLLLATNTPKSFARVSHFFTSHDDYYLANNPSKSYDQLLTSSREQKDFSPNRLSNSRSSILLCVSLSSLVVLCLCYIFKRVRYPK